MTELVNSGKLKQAVPFFMVTNMEAATEFYVSKLGFALKLDWRPEGRVEWCWVERDGVPLMLQEYNKASVPNEKLGLGVSVCFMCEDALMLYREFLQKGLKPSVPFVGNKMWVTSLQDPDGYRLDFESSTDAPEETQYSNWTKQYGL